MNSAKPAKGKKGEDSSDNSWTANSVSPEKPAEVYSPVYKFRTLNTGYNATLNLYDEKMYIMIYSMLDNVVDNMSQLFNTL